MTSQPMRLGMLWVAVLLTPWTVQAHGPLSPEDVPTPLQPWTQWVLEGEQTQRCPFFLDEAERRTCAWPSRLTLTLDERGGTFEQRWQLLLPGRVPLAGDVQRWPQDVRVNGKRVPVLQNGALPTVQLPAGTHTVQGRFEWDSLPEALQVPPETGLLSLTVKGTRVEPLERAPSGQLFVQRAALPKDGDALTVDVVRRLTDEVPSQLTTQVRLHVSGKNREVLLGRALPEGFVPLSLGGPVPARLEPDGRLRVQVRPGEWTLELGARSERRLESLGPPVQPEGAVWDSDGELWAFEAVPALRVVDVEGAAAQDPSQTTLPEAWRVWPTYRLGPGAALRLVERRRGDAASGEDRLELDRQLWLDFDGQGFTVSDSIQGDLHRAWRLEMPAPTTLGRVAVNGRDVVITRREGAAKAGVEVRQGPLTLTADSRIEQQGSRIQAVGWDHDFHQVRGVLNLPPGWRLLHAWGVDQVSSTWLQHWSLLELFLLLVLSLAVGRLYGRAAGTLALLTWILTFPEAEAPKWSWIGLFSTEALCRVLPEGSLRLWLRGARWAAVAVLALVTLPFLATHIREGLSPVQASPGVELGQTHSAPPFQKDAPTPAAPVPRAAREELAEGLDLASPSTALRKATVGGGTDSSFTEDPNAAIQTGPGLPRWAWQSVDLRWSGPVERGQELGLLLLSPRLNLLLAFFRAALLAALGYCLLREHPPQALDSRSRPARAGGGAGTGALLTLLVPLGAALAPGTAQADFPSPELQAELRTRLLRPPECSPRCATSSRLWLDLSPQALRARLLVDADAHTAVPLPSAEGWNPRTVLLDGQSAEPLMRDPESGTLWLAVTPGTHEVVQEGPLPPVESLLLSLPLRSFRVDAHVVGWSAEGLHEDGVADATLRLTRLRTFPSPPGASSDGAFEAAALPAFLEVTRTLRLGLEWRVETRVERRSPLGTAAVAEIPLLPGESVTSSDLRVQRGKVMVNLGPKQTSVSWSSVLAEQPELTLQAQGSLGWVEKWVLDLGPTWHVEHSGIPPLHPGGPGLGALPEWRPWPNESVTFHISRPEGILGQTFTVDQSRLVFTPGLRATDATLTLTLRSSRGAQHILTLPPGAEVSELQVDGQSVPVRQEGRAVTLTLRPGTQEVTLSWRQTDGVKALYTAPEVDLKTPSVNAQTVLELSSDRWVLFTFGPRAGPTVLFWSLVAIWMGVSVALRKIPFAPLRVHEWVLLGLGLSQVHLALAAVVAGWLLALGWKAHAQPSDSVQRYNLFQLLLVGWTAVALVVLCVAVYSGLLGQPQMQVSGNGSTATHLQWFQDRLQGPLPTPWVVSVPLIVYRMAMLAWALWLSLAVLLWLRWGYGALQSGGLWRRALLLAPARPTPPSSPPADPR